MRNEPYETAPSKPLQGVQIYKYKNMKMLYRHQVFMLELITYVSTEIIRWSREFCKTKQFILPTACLYKCIST